jgi:hypothetical protein
MEAQSSTTQEIFSLAWDPSAPGIIVGDITREVRDCPNGINVVAEDEDYKLWADILNGEAVDYRAFRVKDGLEIGIVEFTEPGPLRPDEEPAGNPPPDGGVPAGNPPPDVLGHLGGVPAANRKCHLVCVSGYGGYRCWRKC